MSTIWASVGANIRSIMDSAGKNLDEGQRRSLAWMADTLPLHGVILADEVGTGKTRIACVAVEAVLRAGGRAAVVVPHGLMHQWTREMTYFSNTAPVELTTLADYINRAADEGEADVSGPNTGEWLLLSHGFRAPQVRVGRNPGEWRVALPSYVLAMLSSASKKNDKRTKAGKMLDEYARDHVVHAIAESIRNAIPVDERAQYRSRIQKLPDYKRGGDNTKLTRALQDEEGRKLVEDLLGRWLGEFDLIVIDEAHKSRNEFVDGEEARVRETTTLGRLLDNILRTKAEARRLSVTATPMELHPQQWNNLLARTRCAKNLKPIDEALVGLDTARTSATEAPDEIPRIQLLCEASQRFTLALAPYVTRRRRAEDGLLGEFRARAVTHSLAAAHPHRRILPVRVDWIDSSLVSPTWLRVLQAAEGMSQAALGLSLKDTKEWPSAIKTVYTKLASGHVSADLVAKRDDVVFPVTEDMTDEVRHKVERVTYWYRRFCDARKQIAASPDGSVLVPEVEHPRIMAAVKEIERWTQAREKVLVFGVFLHPLEVLRDVLNVRQALRDAHSGAPVAHAIHKHETLLNLAVHQAHRMRSEGDLEGWAAQVSKASLHDLFKRQNRAYKSRRDAIRKQTKRQLHQWFQGRASLKSIVDGALEEKLHDHLAAFALDTYLADPSSSQVTNAGDLKRLTDEFFSEHLKSLFLELDDEKDEDERALVLRKRIDRAFSTGQGELGHAISSHARLLSGETGWETRRLLQAAFNRPRSSPRVLIAQSQVGREGLDFHLSCRVVMQFHAEWNPAVLEQQIGRVDRKRSLWEEKAKLWLANGAQGEPPFVEVRQLVFEGTYDAFQWDRVNERRAAFDASLFGALFTPEVLAKVPHGLIDALRAAAPSFSPPAQVREAMLV